MKNLQITAYMQHFIRQQVMPGDICIDATMGNGNDTALLSQLAGKRGRVLARSLTLYRRRKPMILQINRTDRYPGSEDTNEKTVCCMYDSRPFPFCGRLQQ